MNIQNGRIEPAPVHPGSAVGETIAIVGLGYVGMPLLAAMAHAHGRVLGFDVNRRRVEALKRGYDETGELTADELTSAKSNSPTTPRCLMGRRASSSACRHRSTRIISLISQWWWPQAGR